VSLATLPRRQARDEVRGYALIELLADMGPMTKRDVMVELGLTESQFQSALTYARENICPELEVAIPHPVPDDGWRYTVTDQWEHEDGSPAIAAGAAYAMGQVENRLQYVFATAQVALHSCDPRSVAGRKANLLVKRVGHILNMLAEIDGSANGEG